METNAFIVIPQQFVNKYNNGKLKVGVNQFNAVQTLDGRWVTSINALDEFSEQLSAANITKINAQVVFLSIDDFPKFNAPLV